MLELKVSSEPVSGSEESCCRLVNWQSFVIIGFGAATIVGYCAAP
jgi:hypothetical protein